MATGGSPQISSGTEYATNQSIDTPSSPYNILDYTVTSAIMRKVNTAIPVRVDSCTKPGPDGAAGYVAVTPLICQTDAEGKTLDPVSLPKLPFFRYQCGSAAVVCDPQPGDIGLAIFAQQDTSPLQAGQTQPVQPGSFRSFSMSDGFYVGGFINKEPETYIYLNPEDKKVTIRAQEVILDTPLVTVKGVIHQTNDYGTGGAGVTMRGGLTNIGGTITTNNVTVETHTHHGVQTGSGNTSGPNAGS